MLVDLRGAPDGIFEPSEIRRQASKDKFTRRSIIISLTMEEIDDAAWCRGRLESQAT